MRKQRCRLLAVLVIGTLLLGVVGWMVWLVIVPPRHLHLVVEGGYPLRVKTSKGLVSVEAIDSAKDIDDRFRDFVLLSVDSKWKLTGVNESGDWEKIEFYLHGVRTNVVVVTSTGGGGTKSVIDIPATIKARNGIRKKYYEFSYPGKIVLRVLSEKESEY